MKKLIVFSGAGLSAASGIQTFRGGNGLWNQHRIEQICDMMTWKDNRELVHEFYNSRRAELESVGPNAAHHMISDWKSRYGNRAVVLTQNIDDLLERAGCTDVVHLHGFLTDMECHACGNRWSIGYSDWKYETNRCPKCNSFRGVKPGVVFFNQHAPLYARLHREFKSLTSDDTVVVIGTSGQVISIDSMIFNKQAFAVLNNLEPSDAINELYYKRVFYKPCVDEVAELDAIVTERMENGTKQDNPSGI
jgi:NAD-dependent deacetylase